MKKMLFKQSVTTKNNVYDVTFNVNEHNEVTVNVENSANQMMCKDLGLVDLSGRKTHVPRTIRYALQSSPATKQQELMIARFKQICTARLAWSICCFAVL